MHAQAALLQHMHGQTPCLRPEEQAVLRGEECVHEIPIQMEFIGLAIQEGPMHLLNASRAACPISSSVEVSGICT